MRVLPVAIDMPGALFRKAFKGAKGNFSFPSFIRGHSPKHECRPPSPITRNQTALKFQRAYSQTHATRTRRETGSGECQRFTSVCDFITLEIRKRKNSRQLSKTPTDIYSWKTNILEWEFQFQQTIQFTKYFHFGQLITLLMKSVELQPVFHRL